MIPIKTSEEIVKMRAACRVAAEVLEKMSNFAREGGSTQDLDDFDRDLMEEAGATSATFGYAGSGLKRKYPAYSCISLNDELVHGIPSGEVILKSGDVLSINVALFYDGFVGDNTRIVRVGNVSPEAEKLSSVTEEALVVGISKAVAGNRIGDISHAIEMHPGKYNYGVVRDFVGHGVGKNMHEEPPIRNYGRAHAGQVLKPGMTLAIEPMFTQGSPAVFVCDDGWTAKTRDGLLAAHCEHTILITNSCPEILTLVQK
jgi:methionyl aminopeptidase